MQMTAEQMASKKLAEWRKNELTQELDIIKVKRELSFQIKSCNKTSKMELRIVPGISITLRALYF